MIADFVDRRGGGLLMLGGARSFGEGGYGGTPVADALPLLIDPQHARVRADDVRAPEGAADARRARRTPLPRLREREEASAKRWPELPQVTTINAPLPIKPAATVLLNGTDERSRTVPVLVVAAVRARQGHRVPAAGLVGVADARQHSARGHDAREPLASDAAVAGGRRARAGRRDARRPTASSPAKRSPSKPRWSIRHGSTSNDAHVMARVTRPGGTTLDVPLQWTGERDGQYRGTFVSTVPGAYEIAVDADRARQSRSARSTAYVRAGAGDGEYFDPTMHEAPLRRIAEETGGRFYTTANVAGLAEDVSYAGRGVTSVEERELWNMPIILIMLVGLVCAEWGYRRAVGLCA